jgi:hypothetical protein
MGLYEPTTKEIRMDTLPEVWQKLEYLAGITDQYTKPDYDVTHQELTDLRDDLNDCAESVQSIRDRIVFE